MRAYPPVWTGFHAERFLCLLQSMLGQISFDGADFGQIADAYLELHREGHTLSVEDFAKALPKYEKEIREKLPAMVEQLDQESKTEFGIPETLAGCVVKDEIGRGAMASVFRAYQPEFDRHVALKVLHQAEQHRQEARFALERIALAKLDHPNIVPVYSYACDQEFDCLVMKLVDGYSLDQLINEDCDYEGRKLASLLQSDWIAFAEFGRDVAQALSHAHQTGIVHRDIKPSNLLIDRNQKVWVADFGLAKLPDLGMSLSRSGEMVGTLRYMAPEQMQGIADERCDVFSLGVTLYEIANRLGNSDSASTEHFETSTLMHIKEKNPDIPDDLAEVIMKARAYNPDDRYQTANELSTVLNRFLAGRVADRRRASRKSDAEYKKSRRRKAAVLIPSIIGLAGFVYWTASFPSGVDSDERQTNGQEIINYMIDEPGRNFRKMTMSMVDRMGSLPDSERRILESEVNKLAARVRQGKSGDAPFAQLVDRFRESSLLVGAKIMRVESVLRRSNLPEQEKSEAAQTLIHYSKLTSKRRITKQTAEDDLAFLTFGKDMAFDELTQSSFSNEHLRSWIARLANRVESNMQPNEDLSLEDEIRDVFKDAQTDSEFRAMLRQRMDQVDWKNLENVGADFGIQPTLQNSSSEK